MPFSLKTPTIPKTKVFDNKVPRKKVYDPFSHLKGKLWGLPYGTPSNLPSAMLAPRLRGQHLHRRFPAMACWVKNMGQTMEFPRQTAIISVVHIYIYIYEYDVCIYIYICINIFIIYLFIYFYMFNYIYMFIYFYK